MQEKLIPNDPEYFTMLWRQDPENATTESLLSALLNSKNKHEEWKHAFSGFINFGTGGLRGEMGIGTNRINNFTIKRIAWGVASYLHSSYPSQRSAVYIGYDTRLHSLEFAKKFAKVLSESGHTVYISPHFCPTPLTAFAVQKLHCTMGVMITASHNPKEYNGCKLYDSTGAQITSPTDQEIAQLVNNIHTLSPPPSLEKEPPIIHTAPALEEQFIQTCQTLFWCKPISETNQPLQIVYTPLHGTGSLLLKKGLEALRFPTPSVVRPQDTPDPKFSTVSVPNPEIDSVLTLGITQLQKEKKDLLFAMDPDADRVRVVVAHQGGYHALTGNQIGILLADFLCQKIQKRQLKYDALITTIVSTPMLEKIAKKYDLQCIETLVGFKNIAQEIISLEKNGKRCLMAMEESYGYLLGNHIYEKDGFTAAFALSLCAQNLKNQGMTLVDYLQDLYTTFGYFLDAQKLWTLPTGQKLNLNSLRNSPPPYIGGKRVIRKIDYLYDVTHLAPHDMLEFHVEEGGRVLIRFSGTEPKVKIYIHTHRPKSQKEEASQDLQALLLGVDVFKKELL